MLNAIGKYTNTDLDITHIASNDFCSKLPVMIASGDLPDVIVSCGHRIDKNGKNDTYGVSSMISNTSFSPDFGLIFGAPNNWVVKEPVGKLEKRYPQVR